MTNPIETLERQRAEIVKQMEELGDMRRGSLVTQYLPCGKPNCCCKQSGHPGHGPYVAFTRKIQGKTRTRQFRAGPELDKLRTEVDTFHRFRQLSGRLIEISERLCELRPVEASRVEVKKTSLRVSSKRSGKKSKR